MNYYDEYQKFMRYKHGHHAFFIVIYLSLINYIFAIQWAETKALEFVLILLIAIGYSVLMNIYTGAYFNRWQSPTFVSFFSFILGMRYIYSSFDPGTSLLIDGRVTSTFIRFSGGLIFVSIPIVYLIRRIVEKRKNEKDSV